MGYSFPISELMGVGAAGENPIVMTPNLVQTLITAVLTKSHELTIDRLVSNVSAASSDKKIPSALAVYNLFKTIKPGMQCTTVLGSISSVDTPDSMTIYLQKDDEHDKTWTVYLYIEGKFVAIGDTNIDLVNYWSKSDADVAALKTRLFGGDSNEEVLAALGLANVLKNDDSSKQIVLGWLISDSADQITEVIQSIEISQLFSEEQLQAIVDSVIESTDERYVKDSEFASKVVEEGDQHYMKKDALSTITEEEIKRIVDDAYIAVPADPDDE